jgi:hypothetical protein
VFGEECNRGGVEGCGCVLVFSRRTIQTFSGGSEKDHEQPSRIPISGRGLDPLSPEYEALSHFLTYDDITVVIIVVVVVIIMISALYLEELR